MSKAGLYQSKVSCITTPTSSVIPHLYEEVHDIYTKSLQIMRVRV